jgi:anhydro-N-acetylmuramic acid kinase
MTISRGFIGVASGSGGEGADAVLVETTGVGLQLGARFVHHLRRQHPASVRELLARALHAPKSFSIADLSLLHRQIAESEVEAVRQLAMRERIDLARVAALGRIGPLLAHETSGRNPVTLEAGLPALVAEATGLTIVSEFRERDVAAGGQGMPIAALADWAFFRHASERRILLHLGSVTSIVVIQPGARPQDLVAFESGPGTRLLDAVIRQGSRGKTTFDVGGKHAVQGRCLDGLLARWLEHSFFAHRPPKSLPRSEFGADWIERAAKAVAEQNGTLEDLLCTLSHFVSRSAVLALRSLPELNGQLHLWLSGGGSRNGFFWRLLEQETGIVLHRLDELGVPAQARQAAQSALLAAFFMDGVPAGSAGTTGVVGRLLGRITPGDARNWARCLVWMADKGAIESTRPGKAA